MMLTPVVSDHDPRPAIPVVAQQSFAWLLQALHKNYGARLIEPWFAELLMGNLSEIERGFQELPKLCHYQSPEQGGSHDDDS